MHAVGADAPSPPPPPLSVVLVGLLPRTEFRVRDAADAGCERALGALATRVLPALRSNVLHRHMQQSGHVDVFGHTWGCGRHFLMPQQPSRPELPLPQHLTVPSLSSAHV